MLPHLRVSVFPGGFNWPAFVAMERGIFGREGIAVELQATTGSMAQMTGLAAAEFEIAMTAFDNVVAYVEGQGEADIGANPEFFAFLGSDDSFLSLVGSSGMSRAQDLRGRTVSVDAATTGYAFVLFDLLERAGLQRGDYAVVRVGGMAQRFDDLCRGGAGATLLSAPYDLLAERAGLHVLLRQAAPYQGNVAAARRSWAANNPDAVAAYIRGYVAAMGWLHDPANAPEACAILDRNVPGMTPDLALASHARMLQPGGGFSLDGRLQDGGVRRVLRLRSHYAAEHRTLDNPDKYTDLRFLERAFAAVS
jgi:ABC-type nitrate/sulfonate/bicarbonate transport system substrate-binding protein